MRLPLIRHDLHDLTPDDAARGIVPDVPVQRTLAEVLAGRDIVLERTRELIAQAREREGELGGR